MSHPATPQVNATVTAVTDDTAATGGRDDWDTPGTGPAGSGASKWTGTLEAYYAEDLERIPSSGGTDLVEVRSLIVASSWALEVGVDRGDVITIEQDGRTIRGRANLIAVRTLPGIPAALQTARIALETT